MCTIETGPTVPSRARFAAMSVLTLAAVGMITDARAQSGAQTSQTQSAPAGSYRMPEGAGRREPADRQRAFRPRIPIGEGELERIKRDPASLGRGKVRARQPSSRARGPCRAAK